MHVLVHEQFVKVTQFIPGGELLTAGKLEEAVVAEKGQRRIDIAHVTRGDIGLGHFFRTGAHRFASSGA